MNDIDEIDRIWRDGLANAAGRGPTPTDPRERIATRVRRQRRTRAIAATATAVVVTAVIAFGVGALVHPRAGSGRVAAVAPLVVNVTDAPGGQLKLQFAADATGGAPLAITPGNPDQIVLPAGEIQFVIHGDAGGHDLVLDGVPGFGASFDRAGETITQDVRLAPGRYLMHCAIPGHTQVGEEALLIVQ